jgi:hypothetical protein
MQPTKVRIDKKVNNMADPRQIYQDPLKAYGLGLGGIRSMIGKQRSPFAEEGPSSTGIKSVEQEFSDDPLSGLNREEAIDYIESLGINTKNPSGAFEQLVSRANKRPEEIFTSEIQSLQPDVSDFSEFAKSYSDVMSAIQPNAVSESQEKFTENANRIEDMPNNSAAFDESALDQIAATIAGAEIPSYENSGDAMAAGQAGASTDSAILTEGKITQKQANEGFLSAMDDFFEASRGAGPEMPKNRTIEEYKKVFSEATGIDTSGEVDKSDALMAFGLALMQNKAGKGFNVGKMLQSVGSAGDKAMPALQKAKDRARQGALAGGKYALQTQSADKATRAANKEKMMNRSKYWFYEKGKAGAAFEGFDNGQFENLNKYELNQLINDPEFSKKYDFINASDRLSILEKRAEGQDLGDEWGSFERISLIGGKADEVPPELQVLAAPADANYKGTTLTNFKLAEKPETIARRFMEHQESINSGAKKFEVLIGNLNKGVSIPKQILGGMQQALRNFGIKAGDMPSTVSDAKRMLNNLAIDEATNILQESGKTLSDNDRKLVTERIGKIGWTSGDVELIKRQLKEIYDLTVLKPQRNLDRAVSWLEQNGGVKFGGSSTDAPTQKELDAMNKANNTNLTMADFN